MKPHLILPVLLLIVRPASAEALKTAVVGCTAFADAAKLAELQAADRARAVAFSRPLVASRACLDFMKGIAIDVDERKPPLVCIRLPGDLSCYWTLASSVDDHPNQTGAGGSGRHGGKHH